MVVPTDVVVDWWCTSGWGVWKMEGNGGNLKGKSCVTVADEGGGEMGLIGGGE